MFECGVLDDVVGADGDPFAWFWAWIWNPAKDAEVFVLRDQTY